MFFSNTLAVCIVLQINIILINTQHLGSIYLPIGRMLSWKVLLDETRLDLTKDFNQVIFGTKLAQIIWNQ